MTRSICKRYFLYLLATYGLLLLLGIVLTSLGISLPSGVSTVLGSMIPALWAGNTWYKEHRTVPASSLSWKLAFYFTLIHLGFASVIIAVIFPLIPEFNALWNASFFGILAGVFLFLGIIVFFTTRVFFAMGAKQTSKADA